MTYLNLDVTSSDLGARSSTVLLLVVNLRQCPDVGHGRPLAAPADARDGRDDVGVDHHDLGANCEAQELHGELLDLLGRAPLLDERDGER
jgi:hypothetical protein